MKQEEETRLFLQNQLMWSQQEQAHWANQNCQLYPEYKVGDIVYMDAKHFTSNKSSKSLGMKNVGLWKNHSEYSK